MTLLAAFQALLSRYSGQDDLTVAITIGNHNWARSERLLGCFTNTLLLRTDVSGDPTFQALLERVQKVVLRANAYQHLPNKKPMKEHEPTPDMSCSLLFQVMFELQNGSQQILKVSDLTLECLEVDGGTTQFDLALAMTDTDQGLIVELEYNTDLFDEAMTIRMLGHFQTLLKGAVASTERRVSELPLLAEGERQQLLSEWSCIRDEYPQDRCVHELFEAQAKTTPNAVAVVFEDQKLTYHELNCRANQLANYLRRLGVGPEVPVGICAERCPEQMVALLGILKAGGSYLPLDPTYPKERLAFMLADTRPLVLLTQERLVEGLPEYGKCVLRLDVDWPTIAQESEENPDSVATVGDLAYVIYTSGSTGRPKGVMVEHRSLANHVAAAAEFFKITASDRVLHFNSLSFDASIDEIFTCLVRGGTLVLRSDQMVYSMQQFVRECQDRAISVLNLPTAFLHNLILAFEREKLTLPPSVRLVNTGGEKLLAQRVMQWHKHVAQTSRSVRLINSYGPTEATVAATRCELRPEVTSDRAIQSEAPIGRPVGKAQIYILDRYLNPVPIGVPGELHIGGPGVARGYLNRPELTEEKFIPHPFSDKAGARLYKTGDIARWRSDGSVEYVGRFDQQVKLRGFRIELGEIERSLNSHAAVSESVVLLREDVPEHKRLVAYINPRGATPSPSELRAFLGRRLPNYMVPEVFVMLEALPLTPNGKVDQRALPTPEEQRRELEGNFLAPRSVLERRLADIWEETLGVPEVDIDENFFELGGDSLLAASMFAQLEKTFGRHLPPTTLFRAPTIRRLAEVLQGESEEAVGSSLVAIQPHGSRSPFFCVHGADGGVIGFRTLAQHLGPAQPFYGLQAANWGRELNVLRIEDIASSYIRELRELQPQGPYFLGGYSFGGIVAFEMAKQLEAQGQDVALLALLDTVNQKVTGLARLRRHISLSRDLGLLHYARKLYKKAIWKSATRLSLRFGYPLPPAWRSNAIEVYTQAASFYKAQPYSGRITLFLAADSWRRANSISVWEHIATGGLEVHEVSGDHHTFFKEPHVQVLAAQLKTCLLKASDNLYTSESRPINSVEKLRRCEGQI